MIGYLDPNGKFYACAAYEHTDFAKKLCEKIYSKESLRGFLAEDYLLSKDWIAGRAREVENN